MSPTRPHQPTSYEVDGITDSIGGHARRYGVTYALAYGRITSGWTIREALGLDERPPRWKPVVVRGVADTLTNHAKRAGIPLARVRSRLLSGWTYEEALELVARHR